jgi:hypothetical protein
MKFRAAWKKGPGEVYFEDDATPLKKTMATTAVEVLTDGEDAGKKRSVMPLKSSHEAVMREANSSDDEVDVKGKSCVP